MGLQNMRAQDAAPAAVVKLSKPLKLNGDADAWAAIKAEQLIEGRLGPVGLFKAAYDDDNFYALIHVQDASPLKNGSSIPQEILKGGDTIGVCFGQADSALNQRVLFARAAGKDVIVALRPQWKIKKPYTYFTAAAGVVPMDFVGSLEPEGAKTHFETTPDGYLAEVKIPWKALALRPSPNLTFSFDVQVIFSDPAGTTNVDTTWWHSRGTGPLCTTDLSSEARLYPSAWGTARLFEQDPGPVAQTKKEDIDPAFVPKGLPITFTLPKASEVSVIIRDKKGWIVRELLRAYKMPAGTHTVYWDGRDRWNSLLLPGPYTYRIGYFDGIKASFMGSVGNSANPPYRTADGLGSAGGMHAGPHTVASATDGNFMYLQNSGEEGQPAMRKIDIATGKSLWFHTVGGFGAGQALVADDHYVYMISAANKATTLVRIDPKTGHDVAEGWKSSPVALGDVDVRGLAVYKGKAFYSVPAENQIRTVDLTTGEKGDAISIPAPLGMCGVGDGGLLVCSGSQVVEVNAISGMQTPIVGGLDTPAAVALDPAGNLYVSELGKIQQIKKFSPGGKLIGTLGILGGRGLQAAPYDPLALSNVTSLAVGPDGNLWFAEVGQHPRRYGVLTPDGKFVRDIFGPARCADSPGFDRDDVSSIYHLASETAEGQFINSIVDYAAYAKSPDGATGFKVKDVWRLGQRGHVETAKDLVAGEASSPYGRMTVFTGTNGKRYLAFLNGQHLVLFLWEKGQWIAAALVGDGNPPNNWSDKNGDGIIQPEETSSENSGQCWGGIGRDLTVYNNHQSLKPASIDARGVPTWVGGKATPYLVGCPTMDDLGDFSQYGMMATPATTDDSIYVCVNNGPPQNLDFWDRASENRIVKIKDGKMQWMVGHHDGTQRHNGDEMMSFGIAGETDGVVLVADVCGNFIGYTSDGLSLGWALTDEKGRPAMVGPNALYVENASPGTFLKDSKTGKHLLLANSCEDIRILEITGVFGNDIKRINGDLTLPRSEPRPVQASATNVVIPELTWEKSIYPIWRGTNVDGYDYEWSSENPVVSINDGNSPVGEIRLRRDAGNLCIFANVLAPTPFVISSTEDGDALFAHGDGVELLFGPISSSPRTAAGPGDTRIFLTATRGPDGQLTGHAFACKPASMPVPPSKELSILDAAGVYIAAGTTAPLDLSAGLVPIPGAVIRVHDRFDGNGYDLEAEIPIALIPEISKITSVSFYHAGNGGAGLFTRAMRSDLSPAHFNVAIWRNNAKGALQRYPWRRDDFAGTDPKQMNPSLWGVAADPLPILLGVATPSALAGIHYEKTISATFTLGAGPTVRISSAIFGGGWFDEAGLKFLTTPPCDGFAINPGPGIEPARDGRIANFDMTAVGIQNPSSLAQRSAHPGDPVTATIKTNFPPGQTGLLHVLWGSYTGNTQGGGDLSLRETGSNQLIDKNNAPDLTFALGFNQPSQARESTFTISGSQTLDLELQDLPSSPQQVVLNAIWIEPTLQTRFPFNVPISLAAYIGTTFGKIRNVEFFSDGKKIGEVPSAPFVLNWKPNKPGSYALTALVTDSLGETGTSAVANIQINPAASR